MRNFIFLMNFCLRLIRRKSRNSLREVCSFNWKIQLASNRAEHEIFSLYGNRMTSLDWPQNHSRTFDPIWLPHWPTCKCTISLMMMIFRFGRLHNRAKILIWLRLENFFVGAAERSATITINGYDRTEAPSFVDVFRENIFLKCAIITMCSDVCNDPIFTFLD